jgi:hypothetical protein
MPNNGHGCKNVKEFGADREVAAGLGLRHGKHMKVSSGSLEWSNGKLDRTTGKYHGHVLAREAFYPAQIFVKGKKAQAEKWNMAIESVDPNTDFRFSSSWWQASEPKSNGKNKVQ